VKRDRWAFTELIEKDDVAGAIFDGQERSDQLLKVLTKDAQFAAEAMKHIRAETYRTARSAGSSSAT